MAFIPHRLAGKRRRGLRCLAALLCLASLALDATVARAAATEYEVKAAFLVNLARFVQWPAASFEKPDDPFAIVIVGDDPFGDVLEGMTAGKTVGGHPLHVRRVRHLSDAGHPQIAFITTPGETPTAAQAKVLGSASVLVVSDTEVGFANGVSVSFLDVESRVRLAINPRRAQDCGLVISSKLLQVASIVGEGGR